MNRKGMERIVNTREQRKDYAQEFVNYKKTGAKNQEIFDLMTPSGQSIERWVKEFCPREYPTLFIKRGPNRNRTVTTRTAPVARAINPIQAETPKPKTETAKVTAFVFSGDADSVGRMVRSALSSV